jgi:molybdopterin converting factor small subunit
MWIKLSRIKVKYLNVYSGMTRKKQEFIEFNDTMTLGRFLEKVSGVYGPKFRDVIFDEENRLRPHAWILVNKQREKDLERQLKDGEVVVFSLPIVGG